MRVHSNTLAVDGIRDALAAQKRLGRVAQSVEFKRLTVHRSTITANAFEIQLEAFTKVDGDGRRLGNSGSYGAGENYAATHDEWGWLLAALFAIDPEMVVGSPAYQLYKDREDFDEKTAYSYNPHKLIPMIRVMGDPYPVVTGQGARAKRGYLRGRYGAGRAHESSIRPYWPHAIHSRTVEEVEAFSRGEL